MRMKAYLCNDCDEWTCSTKEQLVAHYRAKHRDAPEGCYTAVGTTWDDTLTRLMGRIKRVESERQREESGRKASEERYNKLMVDYSALVERWNVILFAIGRDISKQGDVR